MKFSGSPTDLGFVRAADFDRLAKGGEVWRSPEGVLFVLPPGCARIELTELIGTRGVTLVCLEPPGVYSIWPKHSKQKDHEDAET